MTACSRRSYYETGTYGMISNYNGNISEYYYSLDEGTDMDRYSFTYDSLNRLDSAWTDPTSASPPASFSYAYHPNGALEGISRDDTTYAYEYNAGLNQASR